ncbi:phosphoenolpyruvate-protein phosphotransferase [Cnuibacter physcomitrellae]|uniref:Phosphoenolpyruvate-protein phosphotransferase n=1 Tax=Cnuibacter physcomitrellae TaxID=1619308 RepID=A0A1X9LXD2_9MICO|nr:phosphoenolpyruvate--protein phosphotransferase [Cnuibacter physcomitrellae]ARJ06710.1 phosphoenolpyruvate--protein phosphotransferase [Cnuibacter physcomitrellae]GGI38656.1 phosphoenolpyruvate-protein phosphotransferase [Cnuibacter physcomitrellae]
MSTVLTGIGIGRGVAIAPAHLLLPAPEPPADEPAAANADAAIETVRSAFATVSTQLSEAAANAAEPLSSVLEATAMMALDPTLSDDAASRIRDGVGPVTAAAAAVEGVATQLEALGGYMAERATDLRGIRGRVVATLLGEDASSSAALATRSIVVADDLAPAQTSTLDLDLVAAIVLSAGGPTGHTAIIARQLGIPCVVQAVGALEVAEGTPLAVDAASGRVVVDPSAEQIADLQSSVDREAALAADTAPGATSDGHPVQLLANVGTEEDARRAAPTAEGVGLFRTEVLFLDQATAPDAQTQTALYAGVLEQFPGHKVVVRTLDAGADKPLAFLSQADEDNPALGIRGYRLVRTAEALIQEQIEALAAASRAVPGTELWAMTPMIATPAEAADFARRARAAGVATVGVMVEVPAAALKAADILAEVDFVSLGTNDLAQYTMASDRLRGELSDLLSIWQPAVLELVATTARAGLDAGKPVGVCGESAGDPLMALVLTGLGITSLSMAASALPAVRYAVRHHTREQCERIASAALSARTAEEAQRAAAGLVADDVRTVLGL